MKPFLVALIGTVAACDGTDSPALDAPIDTAVPDAEVDAGPDALQAGLVTVTVMSKVEQRVLPDAPVIFTQPDGTTIRTITDSLGQASAEVVSGTSVTAVFTDRPGIATIVDVQTADHLVFGAGRLVPGGTLTLTFEPFDGADSYRLYTPCPPAGRPVTPGTSSLDLSLCVAPLDDTTVLVEALDSLQQPLATVALLHADLTSGAVTLPASWIALRTLAIDLVNPPMFVDPYVEYDAVPEWYGNVGVAAPPAFDLTFRIPTTASTAYVSTSLGNSLEEGQGLVDPIAPGATSYQLDLQTIVQPRIESVSFTPAEYRFDVVAAGQTLDFACYTAAFGPDGAYVWEVFAPILETQTFPVLPADLDPIARGFEYRAAYVQTYEVADREGWDDVRDEIFTIQQSVFGPRAPTSRTHRQFRSTLSD